MKNVLRASLLALYVCALFAVAGAQSRSLDGTWQFAVDREGKLTINNLTSVKDWREIQVPLSWNIQFADLRDYRGMATLLRKLRAEAGDRMICSHATRGYTARVPTLVGEFAKLSHPCKGTPL